MALEIGFIKEALEKAFPDQLKWTDKADWPTAELPAAIIHEIIKFLYDHEQIQMRFLTDITATHFPNDKGREFCVTYHLHQLYENIRLRLKCYLPLEDTSIPSVVDIYCAANWMERETYDFFGINFLNHPNLKRILNVDDMDYFPMRKEYPMEDPTRVDKDDEMFGRGGTL